MVGCCGGSPIILMNTMHIVLWKKLQRRGALDVIPEDEDEIDKVKIKSIILSYHHSHQVCFWVEVLHTASY